MSPFVWLDRLVEYVFPKALSSDMGKYTGAVYFYSLELFTEAGRKRK